MGVACARFVHQSVSVLCEGGTGGPPPSGGLGTRGNLRIKLPDDDHLIGVGEIGQQFASTLVDQDDILDLHAEIKSRLEDQGFEGKDHARFKELIGSWPKVRVFMQM